MPSRAARPNDLGQELADIKADIKKLLRGALRIRPGSIGAPELDPEVRPTYKTITNLCTDPQPVDPTSWYAGANGLILDSTYSSKGAHVTHDPGWVSSLGLFALPGNSFTVDPGISFFGSAQRTFKLDRDLLIALHFVAGNSDTTLSTNCRAYDASGTYLGFFGIGAGVVVPANTAYVWTGRVNRADIQATFPTVDSVFIGFEYVFGGLSNWGYEGSAMVVDAADFPVGTTTLPYGDGTTPGWVTNDDGTSTGRIDLTLTSWLNLTGVPTSFPPSPHHHPISDITGLQAALDTKLESVVEGDGVLVDDTDPLNPIVSIAPATSALLPLTTVVGGVPGLVWDANNELVLTEVPL